MEQVHYIHCPPTQQLKKKNESVVVNEKVQKNRHRFLCASSFITMEWGEKKLHPILETAVSLQARICCSMKASLNVLSHFCVAEIPHTDG